MYAKENQTVGPSGYDTYFCLAAWFLFFLFIPKIFSFNLFFGVACALIVGPWVGIWAIYLMHECWHQYFSRIDNKRLFTMFCCLTLTQPGAYGRGHRSHHRDVNTYNDLEIHPIGRVESRALRCAYYAGSFCFGSLFLLFMGLGHSGTDHSPEAKWDRWMPIGWVTAWLGVALASHLILASSWFFVAASYSLTIWAISFVHRHNEMIEHGAVLGEGSIAFRSGLTRNLRPAGIASWLFLAIVHGDSRAHSLHHTRPAHNWRVGLSAQKAKEISGGESQIDLIDYTKIVYGLLLGRERPPTKEQI